MIYKEIEFIPPEVIAQHFHDAPGFIFFDSAKSDPSLGIYSYIGINPSKIYQLQENSIIDYYSGNIIRKHPLQFMKEIISRHREQDVDTLPPFQGGVAGLFSYEMHKYFDPVDMNSIKPSIFPDMYIGVYDLVISFDHSKNKAWIISTGYPEISKDKKATVATQRLHWLQEKLKYIPSNNNHHTSKQSYCEDFKPHSSKHEYIGKVKKVIEYILAGDIFEANISQMFSCKKHNATSPYTIYRQLRHKNPAPFAAYLNMGKQHILSCSPERFISSKAGKVEACPIKGTIGRSQDPVEDNNLAHQLTNSEKDRAENIMIVDLLRNDMSKVCCPGTINVPKLCELQSFTKVHHLVSTITGTLKDKNDSIDLLAACFPGGSITGAPKVRSMEIIYEIEKLARGPYCGSIGYISFNNNMDSSILIRTVCISGNDITFRAGGAITADSSPEDEYYETLTKAFAIKSTLAPCAAIEEDMA